MKINSSAKKEHTMQSICDLQDINYFSNSRAMITILVAAEFERDIVKWAMRNWDALSRNSHEHWHLLVPIKKDVTQNGEHITTRNYDYVMAHQLKEMYGLKGKELPALVFDDFDETNKQFFITLQDDGKRLLRNVFYDMNDLIKKRSNTLNDLSTWRKSVIGDLQTAETLRNIKSTASGLTPSAGSIISAIGKLLIKSS